MSELEWVSVLNRALNQQASSGVRLFNTFASRSVVDSDKTMIILLPDSSVAVSFLQSWKGQSRLSSLNQWARIMAGDYLARCWWRSKTVGVGIWKVSQFALGCAGKDSSWLCWQRYQYCSTLKLDTVPNIPLFAPVHWSFCWRPLWCVCWGCCAVGRGGCCKFVFRCALLVER